jgi:hypothetical protein
VGIHTGATSDVVIPLRGRVNLGQVDTFEETVEPPHTD